MATINDFIDNLDDVVGHWFNCYDDTDDSLYGEFIFLGMNETGRNAIFIDPRMVHGNPRIDWTIPRFGDSCVLVEDKAPAWRKEDL